MTRKPPSKPRQPAPAPKPKRASKVGRYFTRTPQGPRRPPRPPVQIAALDSVMLSFRTSPANVAALDREAGKVGLTRSRYLVLLIELAATNGSAPARRDHTNKEE